MNKGTRTKLPKLSRHGENEVADAINKKKMTDGDGQVSVETPDTLFLAVHNPQFHNKKLM